MTSPNDHEGIKAPAKDSNTGFFAYSQRYVDRFVSRDTRQRAYGNAYNLAQEQPFLFTFLLVQIIFSCLPILVFAAFTLSTIAFAFATAAIFVLFWIGVALLILVPTLFFTCSISALFWVWAAGSFVVAKRLYEMSPIHARGELEMDAPNGKTYAVTKHVDGLDAHSHK